jgi:hypothetical protein
VEGIDREEVREEKAEVRKRRLQVAKYVTVRPLAESRCPDVGFVRQVLTFWRL